MSAFFQKFRRDVIGIIWLAVGLFLALALLSFHTSDPSFNSTGVNLEVRNYCGYMGSFLADMLYQLWGISAWVFALSAARISVQSFKGKNTPWTLQRLTWASLLLITFSSICSLYFPEKRIFDHHIAVGGLIGTVVSKGLVSAFNFLGVSIILWSLALLLLVFYTERPLRELFRLPIFWTKAVKDQIQAGLQSLMAAGFFRPQLAEATSSAGREPAPQSAPPKSEEKKFRFSIGGKSKDEPTGKAPEEVETPASAPPKGPALEMPRRKVRLQTNVDRQIENWKLPEIALLEDPPASRHRVDEREIFRKSEILVDKLAQFSVNGTVIGAKPGPLVTMYEFKPNADVKISKITDLADDLSLALSSESVRIIAPIPGRDVVGIETSNNARETVYLKDILAVDSFWSEPMKLPICLGRQADGEPKVVDLRKMPHLMVAGTTGSGKSVFVVSAITALLFKHSPKTLRLLLIDPKQVDLAAFNNVPHLIMPPIREPKKAVSALKWAIKEMDKRYRSMSRFGARGLESFNETVAKFKKDEIERHETTNAEWEGDARKLDQYYFTAQPYIVIVVEEFGDLMAVDKANVEQVVVRLAQMARACGIHLILAMQSPRKDVVTGLIKTNIPGRISFKVASKMDSRIILDDSGGERLLPNGDMLYLSPGVSKPQRHHAPWVTEAEIGSVMRFWSEQGEPQFDPLAMRVLEGSGGGFDLGGEGEEGGGEEGGFGESEYDDKYDEVLAWVSSMKEVSASLLQRKFRLGYPRAARMIELFEKEGVVGPANGSKPRQVLVNSYDNLAREKG